MQIVYLKHTAKHVPYVFVFSVLIGLDVVIY